MELRIKGNLVIKDVDDWGFRHMEICKIGNLENLAGGNSAQSIFSQFTN